MAKRVVIEGARLSWPKLFKPEARPGSTEEKYSTMLLIPKSATAVMERLYAAEKEALQDGKTTKFKGKVPTKDYSIIHDGDDEEVVEDYPERAGHWYMSVSASTKFKPGVVDKNLEKILDESEVYSGVYANVSVTAFPYNQEGNKGVSFGLNNVQILGYGDSLAGGVDAADEFSQVADEDLL